MNTASGRRLSPDRSPAGLGGRVNGPKNGNYAPSFHTIDHVIYHTSLDAPELGPASGLERSTRAFAAALDRANAMTMAELRGESSPPAAGQGTLDGTESLAR